MRSLLRYFLTVLLIVSSSVTGWKLWELTQLPGTAAAFERGRETLAADIEALMIREVSQPSLEKRLNQLLDESPRNWVAIDAVANVATEKNYVLTPELTDRHRTLRVADYNWRTRSTRCAACAWDASNCDLSGILFCRVGDLTPIGDLISITREGGNYVAGRDIDTIDLTLSAVGLAAVATAPVSGGASMSAKAGASFARTARGMGRVSQSLNRMIADAAKSLEWKKLAGIRSTDELKPLLQTKPVTELRSTLDHIGVLHERVGLAKSLHLMQFIDTPSDARHLSRVSEAVGSEKTIGRLELLGKQRLIRASMRYSNELWIFISGLVGILTAVAGLLWSLFARTGINFARRKLRAST